MNLSRDLEVIAKQETELMFPEFDEQIAWELGSRLRELASSRHLPVAIEIKRFGQPLFYSALSGSTPDNAEWVRRKGNLVARFHRTHILQRHRIRDPVPNGRAFALQIGEGIFRRFGFEEIGHYEPKLFYCGF